MYLIPLLLLSFNTQALDVVQSPDGTSRVTCNLPTTYTNGTPVRENDVTVHLYVNQERVQSSQVCNFQLPQATVGNYIIHVTAYSAFYNSESLPSNVVQLNVFEQLSPNAPTQLNWD